MKTRPSILFMTIYSLVLGSLVIQFLSAPTREAVAQAPGTRDTQPVPVEEDMHEFMEYLFQPTYRRLKEAMKSEPTDKKAWLEVKSGSIILAEGGNLLLQHAPEEKSAEWKAFSIAVRDHGSKMYRAARAKDFSIAQQSYKAMLQSCNACHQEFAGGEHQLTP
jgi:hypothetical protein